MPNQRIVGHTLLFVGWVALGLALAGPLGAQGQMPPLTVSQGGQVPLFASLAGTPEAGVLAGLPSVRRQSLDGLTFEQKVRRAELSKLRADLDAIRSQLPANRTDPAAHAVNCALRVALVGRLNRLATIVTRLAEVDRELDRRRDR
ncbi:MAG: hypothetical protein HY814_11505 [Candidatus Riflebacteria bacterium]|nr:hypothetical protein [Candidatus Riflebacteria bacterium]